jgi:hypothetical protein
MSKQPTKFEEISATIKSEFSILSKDAQNKIITMTMSAMEDAHKRGLKAGIEEGREIERKSNPSLLTSGLIISADLELSVCGYTSGNNKEFKGSIKEVIFAAKQIADQYYDKVSENYDEYGDHRGYCPQFSNGYPSENPEDGEAVSATILNVKAWYNGEVVSANLRPLHEFINKAINGEIKNCDDAIALVEKNLTEEINNTEEKASPFKR